MKKHILLGAALLSLMAASCSNDEDILDNGTEVVNGKTITLNATINNGADTRLAYTDNGSTMEVAWSDSESFTMYKGTITEGSTFTKTAESGSKFKGNDITGEGTYYAVYGDNITNKAGTLTIDLSGAQVGTPADNGIKEFMLATASELTNSTTLTFNHKLTVLKMTLTLPEGETGTTASKVTVSGLHNMATYDLTKGAYTYIDDNKGDITATNGKTGFAIDAEMHKIIAYVAVFPEDVAAGQVSIIAKVGADDYAYNIPSARKLTAGKVTPVTVSMTKVLNCASGSLNAEAVKAAIVNNNLVIASDKDLTSADFDVLRSVLTDGSYPIGTVNLTLLNQISVPDAPDMRTSLLQDCSALKSVSLPKATTIGRGAFPGCIGLTKISLPEAETIGDFAFYGCNALTEISLPEATTFGESAFAGCNALTTLNLPSATSVGADAFLDCDRSKIALTTSDASDWYKKLGGNETNNYGWKSLNIIKTKNFQSAYTAADYKPWSTENCINAPSYDDMCKYLGAGVYWDNGYEGENQQTYTVKGNTYNTGLWVKKKAYIGTEVTGSERASTYNGLLMIGRPADINKYFFLPAAGSCYNGTISGYAGSIGHYWLSSLYDGDEAYKLHFDASGDIYARVSRDKRTYGFLPMIAE